MADQEFKPPITAHAAKRPRIDTSDLSNEWKRQNGLLPEAKPNTEMAGEAALESAISPREPGQALMDLGNVAAPGADPALAELKYGPHEAVLPFVSACEMIKKSLADACDAAGKLAGELAKPETAGIAGVEKAWDNATEALGNYLARMKTAGAAQVVAQTFQSAGSGDFPVPSSGGQTTAACSAADLKYENDQAVLEKARQATNPETPEGKALQKRIDDAAQTVEDAKKLPTSIYNPTTERSADLSASRDKAIQEAQAELAKAQAEQARRKRQKEQEQLEAGEADRITAKKSADDAAENAASDAEKNQARLRQLPGEEKPAQAMATSKNASSEVVGRINEFLPELGATLKQAGEAAHLNTSQILAIAKQLAEGHLTHSQEIQALKYRIDQVMAQTRQMSYNSH